VAVGEERKNLVNILSHDDSLLEKFVGIRGLSAVNLNRLGLKAPLDSNNLAEFRFLLSNQAKRLVAFDSVTVLSARYQERFPWLPSIQRIGAFEGFAAKADFYAPLAFRLSGQPQFDRWVESQDQVHPGMAAIIFKFLDDYDLKVNDRPMIVMGGNFVLSGLEFENLRRFMVQAVSWAFRELGSSPGFIFRCAICGKTSSEAVGRWDSSRKLGFLLERFMAIYFSTNDSSLRFRGLPSARTPLSMFVSQLLPTHLLINDVHLRVLRLQMRLRRRNCEH
jgi:hypothetical protein